MVRESVPLNWRLKKSRYNMVGSKCSPCNRLFYPRKPSCPDCRKELQDFQLKGTGKILSFTVIRSAPSGFEKYVPYAVGIIRLDEGINCIGQICSPTEAISTGKPVRTVFRKISDGGPDGTINYGIKWEIVE